MVELLHYLDPHGNSPFEEWFNRLNAPASAKITTALIRIGQGNFSNVKSVGNGVFEFKVDFGPGYRIYFGRDGEHLVILLVGGTKKRQQHDIRSAINMWQNYKQRKVQE